MVIPKTSSALKKNAAYLSTGRVQLMTLLVHVATVLAGVTQNLSVQHDCSFEYFTCSS